MTTRYPNKHRLPAEAYEDRENTFHVVVRAVPGRTPFAGTFGERVWILLDNERNRGAIAPGAIVLMPDHLHVVCRPLGRSISRWVQGFKSYSTRIYAEMGQSSFLWQPSFFDRLIRDEVEYVNVIRYVWRNPSEAGLVGDGEAWPWAWVNDGDAWVREE